jgi:hypothetical protein
MEVIYHGSTSPNALEKCRKAAPSYEHGYGWTPEKTTPHDTRWFGDNGAFSAWANGERWNPHEWLDFLDVAYRYVEEGKMPEPDFVVLPDKVGDTTATYERTEKWHSEVPDEWTTYFAMQDGMNIERACRFARDLGCAGVFVGGSKGWKQRHAEEIVLQAHLRDMKAHIARPSLPRPSEVTQDGKGFRWVERIGADSCDTTSVVATPGAERHLKRLENQTTLEDAVVAGGDCR